MVETYQEIIDEYYLSINETNVTFSSGYKINFSNISSLSKESQFFGLEPFYDGIAQRIKQLKVIDGGIVAATEYYLEDVFKK